MEFHAHEISKIVGIKIQVYGFDTGEGLPIKNADYKDIIHLWPNTAFKMNFDELQKRLRFAKLVIGDIADTGKTFFEKYKPAPICCISVDVDRYSSTLPILEMLEKEDIYFTPRVYMYFDDIMELYEFSGENLAIKEFNARHENLKISPEGMQNLFSSNVEKRMKMLHRFQHEKYNLSQHVFVYSLAGYSFDLPVEDVL